MTIDKLVDKNGQTNWSDKVVFILFIKRANNPSYGWRSIVAPRQILQQGLRKKIGTDTTKEFGRNLGFKQTLLDHHYIGKHLEMRTSGCIIWSILRARNGTLIFWTRWLCRRTFLILPQSGSVEHVDRIAAVGTLPSPGYTP